MKSKKKVVILTEGQVKSLMGNLRVERDKRVPDELPTALSRDIGRQIYNLFVILKEKLEIYLTVQCYLLRKKTRSGLKY